MDDVVGQDRPIADIGQVGSAIDTESAESLLFLINRKCAPPSLQGGADVGEFAAEIEKHRKHLTRLFGRLQPNEPFAKWIEEKHPVEFVRARRVAHCSTVIECGRQGELISFRSNRCRERYLCQQDACLNARENLRKAMPRVEARLKDRPDLVPAMLTITMKHEGSLSSMASKFDLYLGKMLKQRRQANEARKTKFSQMPALAYFDGGIMSFEVKRGEGSGLWHLHVHAVVLVRPEHLVYSEDVRQRRYGEACAAFIRDWSAYLGYYPQVDLQALRVKDGGEGLGLGLLEVFKYCFKAGGLAWPDRFEVHSQMHGRKVVRPFGSLIRLIDRDEPKERFDPLVILRRNSEGFRARVLETGEEASWKLAR